MSRFREGVETWGCLSWVEASATSLHPLWEAPGEVEALGTCSGILGWKGRFRGRFLAADHTGRRCGHRTVGVAMGWWVWPQGHGRGQGPELVQNPLAGFLVWEWIYGRLIADFKDQPVFLLQ